MTRGSLARRSAGHGRALPALLFGGLALAGAARGYETDQYSNRLMSLEDSTEELDARVNETLERIAGEWEGPRDRLGFATAVYQELGGLHWVDRIERYAMKSDAIDKLPQHRGESIYAGAPIWARRVNWVFGVGRTISLADSRIGSDKLGHFFSQGLKYFRSHLAGWSEERVARRGSFNERWLFGQLTTSVYSNADLVANWEGYRFYRSLFEDDVVPGKPRIVSFRGRGARIVRPFTWRDHVNDYWDEAANPSFWSPGLEKAMQEKLLELCPEYESSPESFLPRNEAELERRYAEIGLRPALENRMDQICGKASPAEGDDASGGSLAEPKPKGIQ